jgi:ATP-dependent Clp protease ATP-binding subunit ClpC
LLGLLLEREGLAARVLGSLDVTEGRVRAEVIRLATAGQQNPAGEIPFTSAARKALELARREALSLGHYHIGTEHILLGVVREDEGVAARILLDFDADAEKIRNKTIQILSRPRTEPGDATREPRGELSDRELQKMITELSEQEQSASDNLRALRAKIDILRAELDQRRR